MDKIRAALDSRAAHLIVELIPGETDDRIRAALVLALEQVLGVVNILGRNAALMSNHAPAMQNAIIHKVASKTVQGLHPRLTEAQADNLVQKIVLERKIRENQAGL